MTPADLLAFLSERGGCEFAVTACTRQGHEQKTRLHATGIYRLTMRGDEVQATGPSGQTRRRARGTFLDVFGGYEFREVQATGVLTDLGPLFGETTWAGHRPGARPSLPALTAGCSES